MPDDFDFTVEIVKDGKLVNVQAEGFSDKLHREAELLYRGVRSGANERLHSMGENPWTTSGTVLLCAAIGAGLNLASKSGGRWGAVGRGAEVVLKYGAFADLGMRGINTSRAMLDTWHSPVNFEQNKQLVGKSLGSAFVDYPLMMGSGIVGHKLANFVPVRTARIAPEIFTEIQGSRNTTGENYDFGKPPIDSKPSGPPPFKYDSPSKGPFSKEVPSAPFRYESHSKAPISNELPPFKYEPSKAPTPNEPQIAPFRYEPPSKAPFGKAGEPHTPSDWKKFDDAFRPDASKAFFPEVPSKKPSSTPPKGEPLKIHDELKLAMESRLSEKVIDKLRVDIRESMVPKTKLLEVPDSYFKVNTFSRTQHLPGWQAILPLTLIESEDLIRTKE